jgi:inosine-uridine nucleoside N-ribohydrolase
LVRETELCGVDVPVHQGAGPSRGEPSNATWSHGKDGLGDHGFTPSRRHCTRRSPHYVDVEAGSELTRGMTIVEALNVAADERNRDVWAPLLARGRRTEVCWTLDVARWKALVMRSLA